MGSVKPPSHPGLQIRVFWSDPEPAFEKKNRSESVRQTTDPNSTTEKLPESDHEKLILNVFYPTFFLNRIRL